MFGLHNFRPADLDRVVWFSTPKTGCVLVHVKRRGWFVDWKSFKPGKAPSKAAILKALTDPVKGGWFERCNARELSRRVLGARQ
jgi:hypothetical protein